MSILGHGLYHDDDPRDHELSNGLAQHHSMDTISLHPRPYHDSPLTLGASCNHLETIHLPALSVHEISHTAAHWTHCEEDDATESIQPEVIVVDRMGLIAERSQRVYSWSTNMEPNPHVHPCLELGIADAGQLPNP
jgi:hypothetical protein